MKRTLGFLMICALAACEGPAGDKGDTGLTGDKGTMGDKGDKGDPGSVPAALGSLTPSDGVSWPHGHDAALRASRPTFRRPAR